MINIFDDNTLNIDEYKPDSRGVEAAKKLIKTDWFCIIALMISAILVYVILESKNIFELYFVSKAVFYVPIFVGLFWVEVMMICRNSTMRKVNDFTDQEKFDFNYYFLYKKKNKSAWVTNNYLLALGINSALMGAKEKCRDALALLTYDYQPAVLGILREWLDSDETTIDREKISPRKKIINPIRFLPLFLVLDIGVLTACVDYNVLLQYGATRTAIAVMGYIQSVAFVVIGMGIALMLIFQTGKNKTFANSYKLKKTAKIIIGVVAIIFTIYAVLTNEALGYGMNLHKDDTEDISSIEDTKSSLDEDDYEYYEEENSEDYLDGYGENNEAESLYDEYEEDYEEAYPEESGDYELDIMNKMIILCNYLQKNGVIDDFSVELGYNAKGRVSGTVAQDDKYVYVLYDNGNKKDKHGNDCLELVLEAEPLDENGNSLGQTEATLKGFYLVDLESGEVTDEHKTHW